MRRLASLLLVLAACGHPRGGASGDDGGGDDMPGKQDAAIDSPTDGAADDGATGDGAPADMVVMIDAPMIDAPMIDASMIDAMAIADAPAGPITGGPCSSGTAGQTAYRIRWAGNGAGSTAYVVYEVHAMPDTSRFRAGAYGYQIGYTPRFEDPFLGAGGLALGSSNFVDIELTTAGIGSISNATLSILGRSFNTTASGSYNWQTFEGTGATPTNFVSNVAPYQWYSADMTSEISAGNTGVLIRIKAGPNSGSLVVNRIEICMTAS
ncbi:MAG: hypothetical protein JNL83_10010 [Myxococcales bacterium]|nr:hypothetical protein [Myxococcales bacterium]